MQDIGNNVKKEKIVSEVESKNIKIKDDNIDEIIKQSIANIEIEGFKIDDTTKVKLKELLQGKITYKKYLENIKQKHSLPPYDRS